MIALLREGFVNTWLLARDLDDIAAGSGDEDVAKLCTLVRENYGYPVDSVLISSDLRVLGHVNVSEPAAMHPDGYLAFLRQGLAAASGETLADVHEEPAAEAQGGGVRALTLAPDRPEGSLLDVIRRRGFGEPSMTFFPIDATAFAGAGKLEITVRVGSAEAAGRFELCAAPPDDPSVVMPVQTLEKVAPGESGTLSLEFARGALFGLAAMPGGGSVEGDTNAFLATVTVSAR